MRYAIVRLLAVIVASMAGIVAASGHTFLKGAVPSVGGIVSTPPQQIRLTFDDDIESALSGIEVSTAAGQRIATGPAAVGSRDNTQLVLALPRLSPGRYKVSWHVITVDTHLTEGEYMFEIKP